MKKIVLLFLIIFYSCSSPYKLLEETLNQEIKTDLEKKYILIKQKESFIKAYQIFNSHQFTEEQRQICNDISKKYKNEKVGNWKKSDFKKIDIDIVNIDSIINYEEKIITNPKRKVYSSLTEIGFVYRLSNPYYYNNGKNVFFKIIKYRFRNYNSYLFNSVIVMKKERGKWVFVEKIENSDLY